MCLAGMLTVANCNQATSNCQAMQGYADGIHRKASRPEPMMLESAIASADPGNTSPSFRCALARIELQ